MNDEENVQLEDIDSSDTQKDESSSKVHETWKIAGNFAENVLKTDNYSKMVFRDKTLEEWEEYFNIPINDITTLFEIRELVTEVSNKIDECRSIINILTRQYSITKKTIEINKNIVINDKLEYKANNTAKNLKKTEREVENKLRPFLLSTDLLELILNNFKENLRKLQNKMDALTLIQNNLINELKFLNK